MDKDKQVQDLIAAYEAEAARCLGLARALRGALNGETPSAAQSKHAKTIVVGPASVMHTNGEPVSTLVAAIKALVASGAPMHVDKLVPIVSEQRGIDTPRSSVESVLSRAVKDRKHGLMRTAPGTFTVKR